MCNLLKSLWCVGGTGWNDSTTVLLVYCSLDPLSNHLVLRLLHRISIFGSHDSASTFSLHFVLIMYVIVDRAIVGHGTLAINFLWLSNENSLVMKSAFATLGNRSTA